MKKITLVSLLLVLIALGLPLSATYAQSPKTLTMTEQQINSLYRVSNPLRRSLSNVSIDLQAGQATISLTYTNRRTAYAIMATYVPSIAADGTVDWTLTSASANGSPASQNIINALNNGLRNALRDAVKDRIRQDIRNRYTVTEITISADNISITYTPK